MIRLSMIIALSFLLLTPTFSNATCVERGTAFYYGNGMFNSFEDARKAKSRISQMVESTIEGPKKEIKFVNAYKRSEPALEQLIRVSLQKGITQFETIWAFISSLLPVPGWFEKNLKAKYSAAVKKARENPYIDLDGHLNSYRRNFEAGFNVILIAHSQGNLYAHEAYRQLDQTTTNLSTFFKTIEIATPVSTTIQGAPWITFKKDAVMAAVRATLGNLPANVPGGIGIPPWGDLFGHSFTKAYMKKSASKKRIRRAIAERYRTTKYPKINCQNLN